MATPGNDSPHEETCFNRKGLEGSFIDLFHNGDQIVYQDVFFYSVAYFCNNGKNCI